MNETSTQKQIINIGVIGCGCIAQNHVMSITLLAANARKIWGNNVKLVLYALADIDQDAANGMNEVFPATKIYTGPNAGFDLIDDPEINAIFVLVPTVYHLDYVVKAVENDKDVFVEKPLAFSPHDVQTMIVAREENQEVVQPGLVFRSSPQILYMKKIIEENKDKWGKLTNIIFRDSQEKPYKGQEEVHHSTWRGQQELAHAGILFEHTIHDIDGMIFILGKIEDVIARIEYYGGKEGIEDSVAVIASFKNGTTMTVNSMWNDIDFSQRRYELYFERAFIIITVDERDNKAVQMVIKEGKDPEYILDDEEMDNYFRELIGFPQIKSELTGPYYYEDLRFFDAIIKEHPTEITLEAGLYVQKVIEACYESNRTKRVINIDDFEPE